MKKLLAFVLVLALCLSLGAGLAGCVKKETASTDDASGLNAALEYVKTLYKNVNEKTTRDFKRIGTVPVNGTTYEVVWSVDVAEEHVKVVKNNDGTVTIDVNEMSAEDEMIYIFTHYAKHYRAAGVGIKHILDLWVYKLYKPELDKSLEAVADTEHKSVAIVEKS